MQNLGVKRPLLTVAIPIYNASPFLDIAIKSVLMQTFTDFELLLINDGSTDSSLAIMNSYNYDERVKIINDGQNKGLIFRLNQSIDLANGKYYARMDADDIMFLDRLEMQYQFLECNPEVDVLGASSISIDSYNNVIGFRSSSNNWTLKNIVLGPPFTHPSVIGKAFWFKKHKYNINWFRAEDYELWVRTFRDSNFFNLEQPLLFYRELGIPTIKKYTDTQRTFRRILFEYKRLNIPFDLAVNVYFRSYMKSILYGVFSLFNLTGYLVRRRSKLLVDSTFFTNKLQDILSNEKTN